MSAPRDVPCHACHEITSGDCGQHGPRILPPRQPFVVHDPTHDACEAEADALRVRMEEIARERDDYAALVAEDPALRGEVLRLRAQSAERAVRIEWLGERVLDQAAELDRLRGVERQAEILSVRVMALTADLAARDARDLGREMP